MKYVTTTILCFLIITLSCKKENTNTVTATPNGGNFTKYDPETNKNFSFQNFEETESFTIGDLKLFVAKNKENQKYITPHLVAVNKQNEIVFEGIGSEDLFQYNPSFFISKDKKQTIICFQMAYEYNCGMDVFLIENNTVKSIGIIDADLNDESKSIVEVTKIIKSNNQIEFSFEADSLVLNPGTSDLIVPNKVKYIYRNNKLVFVSNDSKIKFPETEKKIPAKNIKADPENQFKTYISKKLKSENTSIDLQETYVGDLTDDTLDDVIVFYSTANEGSNIASQFRIALFVNENGKMKQYPDFAPDYHFSVKNINNNIINIIKYDFAATDELGYGDRSVEIPLKIIVLNNKSYSESK